MEGNHFDEQMRGTTMNGLASRSARRSLLAGTIVALFLFTLPRAGRRVAIMSSTIPIST